MTESRDAFIIPIDYGDQPPWNPAMDTPPPPYPVVSVTMWNGYLKFNLPRQSDTLILPVGSLKELVAWSSGN